MSKKPIDQVLNEIVSWVKVKVNKEITSSEEKMRAEIQQVIKENLALFENQLIDMQKKIDCLSSEANDRRFIKRFCGCKSKGMR